MSQIECPHSLQIELDFAAFKSTGVFLGKAKDEFQIIFFENSLQFYAVNKQP